MRRFKAESDGNTDTYVYENGKLRVDYRKGYFDELEDCDDHFVFRWKNYRDAGEIKLPASVFYELPRMAVLLHWATDSRLFSPVHLSEEGPRTVLFGDKEGSK